MVVIKLALLCIAIESGNKRADLRSGSESRISLQRLRKLYDVCLYKVLNYHHH